MRRQKCSSAEKFVKQFVLFVCSEATVRSRTAEVLCLLGGLPARCCGTSRDSFVPLNAALLLGASEVICFERKHADAVNSFMAAEGKDVCSLGIPDDFDGPFDPRLVEVTLAALGNRSPAVAAAIERGHQRMLAQGLDFVGEHREATRLELSTPADRGTLW